MKKISRRFLKMARVKFTTTLKEENIKILKKLAIDEGISAGELIEKLLELYLKECKEE